MQTSTAKSDRFTTWQVLGMVYTALLVTHLMPQISAEREWVTWAWAVALTVQMLWAMVMSFRTRAT
jgi:hypothetical protein